MSDTPPRGLVATATRNLFPLAALALSAALHSPATAFTFALTGNGSSQTLNWLREDCTTFTSGTVSAANGQIGLTTSPPDGTMGGGMLSWTGHPGSLRVVAMPVVRANGDETPCAGAWGAVDARDVPLVFSIVATPADPVPLSATIEIVPRLVGVVEQFTHPGTLADLWLQFAMSVAVNGQVVTSDSLWGTYPLSDGADRYWPLSFPKGDANSKVITGVTPTTPITIDVWAYMRAITAGSSTVDGFSSYGDGPAIEILVTDVNGVDVPDGIVAGPLSLGARPNPSSGPSQVHYHLPQRSAVVLTAYDLLGRRLATLVDRFEEAGSHRITWDGRGPNGERLAAGVYLLELVAGAERSTGKLVLLGR